jgi:uncharacterized protein YutE (UPF0331/DUF86 family)
MSSDYFNIVKDKEKMQKHLVFFSSFILVHEYFISSWSQGIYFLFTHCKDDLDSNSNIFHTDANFRKIRYEDFRNRLKKSQLDKSTKGLIKNNSQIVQWMCDHEFITSSELDILNRCREQRNIYAHEIDQSLKKTISKEERDLFKSLVEISINASQKWNDKVKSTTPTVKDFFDELADEYNFEHLKFKTNTELFYSLTLANIKDFI